MKRQLIAGEEYLNQLKRSRRGYRDSDYYPEKLPDFKVRHSEVELLAYYLPQFHPFPENDEWWGKGFTEWTNVTRARPQFVGHYQPHLPSDLGFYDLRHEDAIRQQIDLAKGYGLSGFIFYYYWFEGRRVLERPLDIFLSCKDIDFKFSICWSNENWTRRWDGDEHEILLRQTHSPENDRTFIEDISEILKDPRYIHIDGRPLLSVYRAGLFPNVEETVACWRSAAKELIGKDLFLVYAMTFGESRDPRSIGFDAAMQFPPHGVPTNLITDSVQAFSEDYKGVVFDYEGLAANARNLLSQYSFPLIPAVFPSWDNTARRGENGTAYLGSSPDTYSLWIAEAASHAFTKPVQGKSFVIINAWNEWAEGAHLEPDQKFGHAFLRASADSLRPYVKDVRLGYPRAFLEPVAAIESTVPSTKQKTAIIIHAYYVAPLIDILKQVPNSMHGDVFITLADESDPEILSAISIWGQNTNLLFFPNRGRDVRPFLGALKAIRPRGYDYFVKLHTKKSMHRNDGAMWSTELTQPLLAAVREGSIERYLDSNINVALVGPAGHILDGLRFMGSAANFQWIQKLCQHLGFKFPHKGFSFVAGSMFAGRAELLKPLVDDPWLPSMFEEEMARRDGTLAHALERMFGLLCVLAGKEIAALDIKNGCAEFSPSLAYTSTYQYAQEQPWPGVQ
jgi:lipopolysaccharide biosynthesis protein